MKKRFKFVGALLGGLLINAFGSYAQQYCGSKALSGEYEYISKVSLGTIDNQSNTGLYQDFTSLKAFLYIGENYTLSVTTEQYSPSDKMEVYIDWNADKVFTADEKLPIVFTGVASKQGTVSYKMVIPSTAVKAETRMRIVLYDGASGHAGYANGCGNFEYGEVEDYAIEVKSIETAPEVDFFGDVTSVFLEGVVRFSDNSRLAPTQWKWSFSPSTVEYLEGTSDASQNPVVRFHEATNYSVSLTASNNVGSATKTRDAYIAVKNYSAPKNLKTTTEGSHVNLTWNIPNVPTWLTYIKDISECSAVLLADTEHGTLFDDDYLPFSFPVTIAHLSTYFYQSDGLPWTNNQFTYKIYNYSDNKLIYESPTLTGQHLKENVFELPSSITLTEPFIVAVAIVATDGTPSNIAKNVKPADCHTVVWNKETQKWELYADASNGYEMYNRVYIAHDAAAKVVMLKDYVPVKIPLYSNNIDRFIGPANVRGAEAANSILSGYKVFRDNAEVGSVATPTQTNFVENGVADGVYNYTVKAVYSPTGISPFSNTAEVTVDNSNPEVQIGFEGNDILNNANINVPANVDVNSSRDMVFTIKNEGRGTLTLGEVVLDNPMYSVVQQPTLSLAGGEETSFTIKFLPTTDGPHYCKVTIQTNDSNENPFIYNIKGIGGQDRWTYMVYMYEDGQGLDGDKDLNEWEVAGSVPGEVNYIILYDCNDDSRDGIWYVKKDANGFNRTLVSEKLTSQLYPNMSSPETLRQYMLWVKDHYPAQHYGLTVWDHGDGIFKRDGSSGQGVDKGFVGTMKLWQMSAAVKDFVNTVGKKMDIVGFDVCLLGQIETAYQFKDLANYVVASELTEPGDGWDYNNGFQILSNNSSTQADTLAKSICKAYSDAYNVGGSSYVTSSTQAVYSSELLKSKLIPALNAFADSLIKYVSNFKSDIRSARDRAWVAPHTGGPSNPEHHDLGNFAQNIINTDGLPATLKTSAQNMLSAYNQTVIRHDYTGGECAAATGMKIWMPDAILDAGTTSNYYTKPSQFLTFGETHWPEFLKAYQTPPSTEKPTAKFSISSTEVAVGGTLVLTDISLQSPNKWKWSVIPLDSVEFVNNSTSNSQNPTIKLKGAGYYSISLTVENALGSDDTLSTFAFKVVQPAVDAPGALTGNLAAGSVNLNWSNMVEFANDNFDTYSPFSLNFGSWKQVDQDKSVTYGINGYAFENSGYTGSFITFDGNKTTPVIGGWNAPSGTQVLACFDAATPDNNDWLISAKVTVKAGDVLSFYGCSLTDKYGLERMQVGISTTGRETTDFTMVTAAPYTELPTTWTKFQYDLSAYVGKEIYFCLHVVSHDAWAAFFDNMHVGAPETKNRDLTPFNISASVARQIIAWNGSQQAQRAMAKTGTIVFRNGLQIADLASTASSYQDKGLANGSYTYFIQNVYTDAALKMYSSPSNTVKVSVGVTGI